MKTRTKRTLLPLALLPLLSLGCSEKQQDRAERAYDDTKDTVRESASEAGDALTNAWDHVADFSADQKDEFVAFMQRSYADLKSGADKLRNESGEISDEAAREFDEANEVFQEKMDKTGDASADAWDTTKDEVKEAWNNLVEAYENMKSEASSS